MLTLKKKAVFVVFCLDAHFYLDDRKLPCKTGDGSTFAVAMVASSDCTFIPSVHLHLLRGQSELNRGDKHYCLTANKSA